MPDTSFAAANVPPAAASPWGPGYRRLTVGLLLSVAGVAFEALAVATTLPLTVRDLGGMQFYGWAFSAFMLLNLVGITIAGGEADRSGPARPFVIGSICFALGLIIAGAAPTMQVLILGRAVQGLGAGFIAAIAYVTVGRGYPETLRPRMIALMSSAWVIPGLIGPAIAGGIAEFVGWRWVFFILVPFLPLAVALVLPNLRSMARTTDAPRDLQRIRAAIQLAGGAGLALAGIGTPVLSLAVALFAAGVLLALPALILLLPRGTLRGVAGLPAAVATMGLLHIGYFGADSFVPLTLTAVRGQTATVAGLALTAATVCWTVGAWAQAYLVVRQSRRLLTVVGLVIVALGIAGFTGVLAPTIPIPLAIAAWGLTGLGMGLTFSTVSLVILESAQPGEEGAAAAAMQLANGLGIAIGAGIGGAIVGHADAAGTLDRGLLILFVLATGFIGATMVVARGLRAR